MLRPPFAVVAVTAVGVILGPHEYGVTEIAGAQLFEVCFLDAAARLGHHHQGLALAGVFDQHAGAAVLQQQHCRQQKAADGREAALDHARREAGTLGSSHRQGRRQRLPRVGQSGLQHVGRARPFVVAAKECQAPEQGVVATLAAGCQGLGLGALGRSIGAGRNLARRGLRVACRHFPGAVIQLVCYA